MKIILYARSIIHIYTCAFVKNGVCKNVFEYSGASLMTGKIPEDNERRAIPNSTKKAERIRIFDINHSDPRTMPRAWIPTLIGAKKNKNTIRAFEESKRIPLLSTIKFPKIRVRVISGVTKVIWYTNK